MKKNIIKKAYILLSLLFIEENIAIIKMPASFSGENTLYNQYTEAIAREEGYYDVFKKEQAKVSNFLRSLDKDIRDHIQDLKFNFKIHQATTYLVELNGMLKNLEIKFGILFQAADEAFLLTAAILDENDNPKSEKIIFINKSKKDLQLAVNKLIAESIARFKNAFR